jgi:hypothetical protein
VKDPPPVVEENTGNVRVAIPQCIRKLIARYEQEPIQNPPRKIMRYTYKGNIVYYVPPICCDIYSDLMDRNCNIIAHPDGGYTGKGDGRAPDFMKARADEEHIWEDTRTLR